MDENSANQRYLDPNNLFWEVRRNFEQNEIKKW